MADVADPVFARDAGWRTTEGTGQRTGHAADLDYLRLFRQATDLPLLVGSGVTPDNAAAILSVVDGCIVGSAVKTGGVWWDPVDRQKAQELARRVGRASGDR